MPQLSEGDERHLGRSLRTAPMDLITLSDGEGRYCYARFGRVDSPESEILTEAPPEVMVSVGFSPVKAQKPEWLVQKLTEVGVDFIQPLVTDRGVIRWDAKKILAMEQRLNTAAREAAMQCRRVWLPRIAPPKTIAQLVKEQQFGGLAVALADPDGQSALDAQTMLLIGPEGGWSDEESATAPHVSLPGHVLRAETAVIAAGLVLDGLRSGVLGR